MSNEFLLQAMYGMVDGSSYKKQYEKNLERAVAKGDMSVPEFHEQKTKLRCHDLSGVDDGHSCTRGTNVTRIFVICLKSF